MIRYKGFNIFAFSDTHGKHEEVQIPPDTDILICAGDVETDEYNFARFLEWFEYHSKNRAKLYSSVCTSLAQIRISVSDGI